MNIKITYNNRNCNSNKLLKVQLPLNELFILAVNFYMYGTVNVHESTRMRALIRMGALIGRNRL